MIAKTNRLHRSDIGQVIRKGKRVNGEFLVCHMLPSDQIRLAVVVPKKAVRGATDRQRTRRIIMGSLQEQMVSTDVSGYFVFRVIKPFPTESSLKADLIQLVKKISS